MDISVIVATFNQEDTISRALDSILSQEFDGEYEVLVGDDCSTDGTADVCRDYARRFPGRVRHIRRERNLGVVGNYFGCIREAKGRYLADCAGDDFWVDDKKLQRQYNFLENNPDVSMVTTDWVTCDPDGGNPRRYPLQPQICQPKVWEKGELCVPLVAQKVMPHLCSALYRKDPVLKLMNEDPAMMTDSLYTCEDLQIMLALSMAGKVVALPGVSLHYSLGHDSISHRKDASRRFDYSLPSLRQTLKLCRFFGIAGAEIDEKIRLHLDYIASMALRSADKSRALRFESFLRDERLTGGAKARLYSFIMHHPMLWKCTLAIKKGIPGRDALKS